MIERNPPCDGRGQNIKLGRRRESVTAAEILEWLRARPGVSWEATIRDIERVLDDICQ